MGRNARRPGEIDGRAGVAKVYRILGYLIAAEVAVQAAAIAFASFGFSNWIDNGGVADLATFESDDTSFTGFVGYSFTVSTAPCTYQFCRWRFSVSLSLPDPFPAASRGQPS
ncbi:MAG TPA: hypothetical protein VES60_11220 [Nakamurella sp.]|nr:hypothetical protein [Nakamurella sp.]